MKKSTCVTTRWSLCPAGVGRVSQVWCASLRFLLCGLWLCGGLLCAASPAQAAVKAGNILVADQNGGTGSRGALFVVNPKTGQRTILSDFGNPAQGSLGNLLWSVAVGRAGEIFVSAFLLDPPLKKASSFGSILAPASVPSSATSVRVIFEDCSIMAWPWMPKAGSSRISIGRDRQHLGICTCARRSQNRRACSDH